MIVSRYSSPSSQLSRPWARRPLSPAPGAGLLRVLTGVATGEEVPSDGASPVVAPAEGASSPAPAPGAGPAGDDGTSATAIACAGATAMGAGRWDWSSVRYSPAAPPGPLAFGPTATATPAATRAAGATGSARPSPTAVSMPKGTSVGIARVLPGLQAPEHDQAERDASERAARRPPAPETVPPVKTTKRSAQDRRLPSRSQLSRRGSCAGPARGRRRARPRSAARARAAPRAGSRPCARCSPPSACRRGR